MTNPELTKRINDLLNRISDLCIDYTYLKSVCLKLDQNNYGELLKRLLSQTQLINFLSTWAEARFINDNNYKFKYEPKIFNNIDFVLDDNSSIYTFQVRFPSNEPINEVIRYSLTKFNKRLENYNAQLFIRLTTHNNFNIRDKKKLLEDIENHVKNEDFNNYTTCNVDVVFEENTDYVSPHCEFTGNVTPREINIDSQIITLIENASENFIDLSSNYKYFNFIVLDCA